jgi:quinol monooxygenase YgiN
MPALMTAQLPGAKKEMIDEMEPLLDEIRGQKGFVIHTNGPVPGGWRVVEVWDSQSDFEACSRTTSSQRFRRAPQHYRSRSTT